MLWIPQPKWNLVSASAQASGGVETLTWPTTGAGASLVTTGSPPAVTPPATAITGVGRPVRINRIETLQLANSCVFELRDADDTNTYIALKLSNTTHAWLDLNIELDSGFAIHSFPATNANIGVIAVYFTPIYT